MVAQKKSLKVYKLNKDFTHVVSPIDGQVSRYYLTLGNLVNQDQTLLTTIVSLDPMYVYFDMDESTLLQIRKAIAEGKITPPADGDNPGPAGACRTRTVSRIKATINFVNNQVNSTTGSITMRGVFANPSWFPRPRLQRGGGRPRKAPRRPETAPSAERLPASAANARFVPRLFSPGMFVRVRLPIGEPHPALLVIDRAIQSDQGLKYVYVLDAQNKVQTRSIKTGALQEDGLRVVEGEIRRTIGSSWARSSRSAHRWKSSRTAADAVAGRASRGGAAAGRPSKARSTREPAKAKD